MKIRLAASLQKDSIVDGDGIRTVIWTQGCAHNCPGCHNPSTHDFNGGKLFEVSDVIEEIRQLSGQDGITFSGGDPLYQPLECLAIAREAHKLGLSVWCYTGFTYEEILKNKDMTKLLSEVDVLIDGRFVLQEKSLDIYFRGSRNQRIIDVPLSLQEKRVVLLDKYMHDKKSISGAPEKQVYMFI